MDIDLFDASCEINPGGKESSFQGLPGMIAACTHRKPRYHHVERAN